MPDKSFTGVERRRTTRLSVRIIDRVARVLITVGGIGTILAVLMIMVFLIWVVVPLFTGGEIGEGATIPRSNAEAPLRMGVDEYRIMGFLLLRNGQIRVYRLDTGETIETLTPFADTPPSSAAMARSSPEVAFGFPDGSMVPGRMEFSSRFLDKAHVPAEFHDMKPGEPRRFESGMVQKTPEGQYRIQTFALTLEEDRTARVEPPSPIVRMDLTIKPTGPVYALLTEDSRILIREATEKRNLLTGRTRVTWSGDEIALNPPGDRPLPDRVLLSDGGRFVYLVWRDGFLARLGRVEGELQIVETVDLLRDDDAEITALSFITGKSTFLVGDSRGRVRAWFPVRPERSGTLDGTVLTNAHELLTEDGSVSPVTAFGPSSRARLVSVGYADGSVRLFHVTSGKLVAARPTALAQPVQTIVITPKEDGIVAVSRREIATFAVLAEHPDVSIVSLFGKVWYEGYPEPENVWQSTGGTDAFEPKLGLVPLIFGTVKATLYSMLFGLPIALLAAIFASEFLDPRAKSMVKPTIEIMASLPSVVLGFLAALVIAPFVEDIVPHCLTAFFTIPISLMLGAYVWQLLPRPFAIRMGRFRIFFMFLCFPIGLRAAAMLGPVIESALFAGDIRMWLDGQRGSAFGGFAFLLFPMVGVAMLILTTRGLDFKLIPMTSHLDRVPLAVFDLCRFLVTLLLTLILTALLAFILTRAGLDTRGAVFGTYSQRNALVVGFVMGFAIIPIIFTIAEDALSAVPDHLRSASLGAGATPWQTAIRIVVPTAMSGLFSAVMIGLGRAVGETMIVLMAAGNTPIMDWSIFSGFRTLSANLAVELPEAVRDSTHYRTLFLAALTLFAMTFVVNSVAEVVRARFRRKAVQL